MTRNTGGIRSRPNFRPGGSNYTNTSYNEDLDCKDLHTFGSIVCNGEQRVQGNIISSGMHVSDSGVLKVPVIAGGTPGALPLAAPEMAGLVVVKSVARGTDSACGLFYSRLHNTSAGTSAGAQATIDKINELIAETPVLTNNTLISDLNSWKDGTGPYMAGIEAVIYAITADNGAKSAAEKGKGEAVAKANELAATAAGTFEWVAAN